MACSLCGHKVHSFDQAHRINRELCVACGECAKACPTKALELVGRDYTTQELFDELQKDKAFYGESGGVTFSGGECMLQIDALLDILKKCKESGINTVVDTSGYVPFESFERILPYTDLFLYDIKCLGAEKHKELVGVDNGLIIDNLKKLLALDARVIVRIPVIADVNDGIDEMQSIKKLLDSFGKKVKVELLPYHAMGESKYIAIDQKMRRFQPPTPEKMQALKAIFE